jgi:hypothetical protein
VAHTIEHNPATAGCSVIHPPDQRDVSTVAYIFSETKKKKK